jgi:hypothetical protein
MGKPLQLKHHLKALDDKSNKFFTELEPWLSHHPRPDKPLYINMVQCMVYTRGYKVNIENIDYVIEQTKPKEIEVAKKVCQAASAHTPVIFGSKPVPDIPQPVQGRLQVQPERLTDNKTDQPFAQGQTNQGNYAIPQACRHHQRLFLS